MTLLAFFKDRTFFIAHFLQVKSKFELPVSKGQRARNAYQSKLINKAREEEKFTVVLLTYKRKHSLTGLMKMMLPVKRVDKVCSSMI